MLRQANGGSAPAVPTTLRTDQRASEMKPTRPISVKGDDIIKNILWLVSLSFLVIQVLETIH